MSQADPSPAADAAPVTCPECGRSASGNFCSHCGARLGGRFCDQCGAPMSPEARFCNQCGAAGGPRGAGEPASVRGAGRPGREADGPAPRALVSDRNLAWWLLGVAMFVLIVVLGVSMVDPAGPGAPTVAQPAGGAPGTGTPPDISSMTPIEAATRLFNRVMAAAEAGDSTEARAFLPMAIAAYDRARPLDHDGLYHLSVLQNAAGQLDAALDNATRILDEDPDHVLGLLAAAHAADELGLDEEAHSHYEHLLEVYDDEMARGLQEYRDHARTVSSARAEAQAYLAGR